MTDAFQDRWPHNHCFGCGAGNALGLRIRSYWADDGSARCEFQPLPHHCAGPAHVVNGGIISTVIDCHAICTAMADADAQFVTGRLDVSFRAPAKIARPLLLRAVIAQRHPKKTLLDVEVFSGDMLCATATVVAVRVADGWADKA